MYYINIAMYYNVKNEKIYYMSAEAENVPLNIFLAGITLPNPNYIISHNSSSNDELSVRIRHRRNRLYYY